MADLQSSAKQALLDPTGQVPLTAAVGPSAGRPQSAEPLSDAWSLDTLEKVSGYQTIPAGAALLQAAAPLRGSELEKLFHTAMYLRCTHSDWERALEYLLDPAVSIPARWSAHKAEADALKEQIFRAVPAGVRGYFGRTHDLEGNPLPEIPLTPDQQEYFKKVAAARAQPECR